MVDTVRIGVWLDVVTALFFLYVSWRVQQISKGPHRIARALRWSQLFWVGTAAFMLLDGGYGYLATRYSIGPPWHAIVLSIRRIIFVAGLAGLLHLLLTLQSARDRHVPWLLAASISLGVFLEAYSLYQNPQEVVPLVWGYALPATQDGPFALNFLIGTVLFAPVAVAGGLLLRLVRGVPAYDKFRIIVLAIGAITFPLGVLIGFYDNQWYWYGIFENRIAFSVALGMLLAVRPPVTLRYFWKIEPVQDAQDLPHARR